VPDASQRHERLAGRNFRRLRGHLQPWGIEICTASITSPDAERLPMRAEAEKLAEAIRQSLALLRRHL
jgi:hypothetical protein